MTDPNVLGGDKYGLKFIFASGDTKIVHLGRPAGLGASSDAAEFPNELLSLVEMNSGLEGQAYVVPSGKSFFMMSFYCMGEGTNDMKLSIQRNSTINNQALGDNLWQGYWEMATESPLRTETCVHGLHFEAGDYVTPYNLSGAGHLRWGFQCWGVECDA